MQARPDYRINLEIIMYVFEEDDQLIEIPESKTTISDEENRYLIPLAKTAKRAEMFRRWYHTTTGGRAKRVSVGPVQEWKENMLNRYGEIGCIFFVEKVWKSKSLHGEVQVF